MRTLQHVKPTPEQITILADDRPGFRLIRGAAGSGKTTAALLRLRQLCASRVSRQARLQSTDPVNVLVLTFNRTLRGYIQQLASEQVDLSDTIDLSVSTFGSWAWNLIGGGYILRDTEREERIGNLLTDVGVPANNLDYFVGEVQYILGRFPPDKREAYMQIERVGRGIAPAVQRPMRKRLLAEVIKPYEEWKSQIGKVDWNDVALKASGVKGPYYDVVVVDEAQDLSANQLRAVSTHLNKDHATTFIMDAVQRIYPQAFRWREIDIEMRPQMVFPLKTNHRNTQEIARFASSLVQGLPAEEDGVLPNAAECKESGSLPQVIEGKYGMQLTYMLNRLIPFIETSETVAILQPKGGGWFDCARYMLSQRNLDYCELTRERDWPTGRELIALSTIHSAKGLEFDHVLMPGLNQEVTPHGDEEGDGRLDELRRLVAMGIGRARKTATLGYKPGQRSGIFDFFAAGTYKLIKL